MTALRVCNVAGCPNLTPAPRCEQHQAAAAQARRPDGNPYSTPGHRRFRAAVLARDPICVLCHANRSSVADHHPRSRLDLIDLRLNPDDPRHGRGLCEPCHNRATAEHQPGGWNAAPESKRTRTRPPAE